MWKTFEKCQFIVKKFSDDSNSRSEIATNSEIEILTSTHGDERTIPEAAIETTTASESTTSSGTSVTQAAETTATSTSTTSAHAVFVLLC